MLVGMAEVKCPEMSHFFHHKSSVESSGFESFSSLVKSEQYQPERSIEQPSLPLSLTPWKRTWKRS